MITAVDSYVVVSSRGKRQRQPPTHNKSNIRPINEDLRHRGPSVENMAFTPTGTPAIRTDSAPSCAEASCGVDEGVGVTFTVLAVDGVGASLWPRRSTEPACARTTRTDARRVHVPT